MTRAIDLQRELLDRLEDRLSLPVSHDEQLNRYLGVVEATFECNNQQHPNTQS